MADIRRELQPQHHRSGIAERHPLCSIQTQMDDCLLHAPWPRRRGGGVLPVSACLSIPGQIARTLCAGKERR